MSKIKIALCQMNVIDNKQENILNATSMINEAASYNSNFIVLPEMFNCPYSNDKFVEYAEEENESPTLNAISKLAENMAHIFWPDQYLKKRILKYSTPATSLIKMVK